MTYNKTYIIFDGESDMRYYSLMKAWKNNENINFNFYDAHDVNHMLWASNEQYIKSKLRERMDSATQVLVLIGERTRYHTKYIKWEIELANEKGLPIIVVNLDGSNYCNNFICHPSLKSIPYVVHVPFGVDEVKYALENFSTEYYKTDDRASHERYYSCFDNINIKK